MVAKRVFDVVAASMMLLLAIPISLPIVAVLALTGEREIFYGQIRIGRGGRPFKLLKFATMLKDSPNLGTGTVTIQSDPRVLPVGRVLRKTKLNELPQIWNVLRGDMSLVGPRPLTPQDLGCYSDRVREKILGVRPGLTGVGSVVFRDEESLLAHSSLPPLEAYRQEIAPHKGRLECWYVDQHSLLLDLKLLVLTMLVVLWPKNRLAGQWLTERARDALG
jgi:lipopolysaccharide/colanic/teichoic acid biosynthesis glycosyltransferase